MRVSGLGDYIRERRKEMGITQRELAQRIGVEPAYVSQIETGIRGWPQKHVPALARELGVSEVSMAVAAGLISSASVEVGQ